ncbi:chromosome segregation ATPase [Mycolicibacterium sp. BK556]|uniref:hypothetical protein n=1 Tax=Mycobacteriaceae TaxID=1762 RepID=UPI000D3C5FAF|nr:MULTISPECIES: hypothetical protein [Mycobacteriaceae]MBB3606632.1 chromosome segregation ATPase [Mycolicibacterium sp. BK556]MBB3636121.1 chromosome segregation ATPase [Mycolicibacterium sp. BK607]MBB3753749.1 chromosome segregation ATPase [Mycolicibacterium sp. BK634]TDO06596.1 hypothetical protein EV580_6696 [Mycobacterium sp. BK086]
MAKTTAEALVSVCDRLRQQADHIEVTVAREKRRVDGQRAEIKRLKAEPNPDEERIAVMEHALAELTEQLTEDQDSLAGLKADIAENCR